MLQGSCRQVDTVGSFLNKLVTDRLSEHFYVLLSNFYLLHTLVSCLLGIRRGFPKPIFAND